MTQHEIAFLHTADVHVSTFQNLINAINPNIRVRHDVDPELLSDAMKNGLTHQLTNQVKEAMQQASNTGAKVVVCTCSTIGGIAESIELQNATAMRIDRAMADLSVQSYSNILVIAALESTLKPTEDLLTQSASELMVNPNITLKLVPNAWDCFMDGDIDGYIHAICTFINREKSDFDCVVLAQASMAPAAVNFEDSSIVVVASPKLGVEKAIESLEL